MTFTHLSERLELISDCLGAGRYSDLQSKLVENYRSHLAYLASAY
jgi:hypothetical protein